MFYDLKIISVNNKKYDQDMVNSLIAELRRLDKNELKMKYLSPRELEKICDVRADDLLRVLLASIYGEIRAVAAAYLFENDPVSLLHYDHLKTLVDRTERVKIMSRITSLEGDQLSMLEVGQIEALLEAMRSLPPRKKGSISYHSEAQCVCALLERLYEKFSADAAVREDIIAILYLFVNSDEYRNVDLKNSAVRSLYDLHVINYLFKVAP